jgi:Na+-driven multidrug efflux pump
MVTALGTVSVNTYSYMTTIMRYVYIFSAALGQGTAIVIGWEVGKQRISEAKSLCMFSVRCSFGFAMAAIGLLSIFRKEVMGLFTADPDIIALGATIILSDFLLETGRSRNLILVNSLRAAGDVHFPLYIGLFSMWFFSVGFSWLLGIRLGPGLVGVWIAMTIDWLFRAVCFVIRYKREKWVVKSS